MGQWQVSLAARRCKCTEQWPSTLSDSAICFICSSCRGNKTLVLSAAAKTITILSDRCRITIRELINNECGTTCDVLPTDCITTQTWGMSCKMSQALGDGNRGGLVTNVVMHFMRRSLKKHAEISEKTWGSL